MSALRPEANHDSESWAKSVWATSAVAAKGLVAGLGET
jgi:hypothetical protein